MLDLAIAHKLIVRSGAWFRYGDQQLGQGRERVRYMKENPQFTEELRTKILAAGGTAATIGSSDAEDAASPEE